jgi:hypothetical protein
MNFAELVELFAQRGHDRQAIAEALHLTTQQIDTMQWECVRLADEINNSPSIPGGRVFLAFTDF